MQKENKITKVKAPAKAVVKKTNPTKTKRRKKAAGGRPKIDIREYFKKMLPYLQRGLSVAKACQHAKVPHSTVSLYMQNNPEFLEEIECAKRTLEIAARNKVANAINKGNVGVAQWYLERKCKDEFSSRVENINENHESDVVMIELPKNGRETLHPDDAKN